MITKSGQELLEELAQTVARPLPFDGRELVSALRSGACVLEAVAIIGADPDVAEALPGGRSVYAWSWWESFDADPTSLVLVEDAEGGIERFRVSRPAAGCQG